MDSADSHLCGDAGTTMLPLRLLLPTQVEVGESIAVSALAVSAAPDTVVQVCRTCWGPVRI